MENASKALLMAGGILIALLIIAMLLYSFSSMSGYFDEKNSQEETEQLTEFNNQFEAYNRKLLRGTEVISVMNKVLDNNKKYGEDGYNIEEYLMEVEFEITEKMVYKVTVENNKSKVEKVENVTFETGVVYNQDNFDEKIRKKSEEIFTDFKRRIFDCVGIEYNKNTGRVCKLKFKERTINYDDETTFYEDLNTF
jgi:hypothetical protein